MDIVGTCDFWNKRRLPEGCNFSPESLRAHRTTTRTACPKCVRSYDEVRRRHYLPRLTINRH